MNDKMKRATMAIATLRGCGPLLDECQAKLSGTCECKVFADAALMAASTVDVGASLKGTRQMPNDIVERLRSPIKHPQQIDTRCHEAADEIERLRNIEASANDECVQQASVPRNPKITGFDTTEHLGK